GGARRSGTALLTRDAWVSSPRDVRSRSRAPPRAAGARGLRRRPGDRDLLDGRRGERLQDIAGHGKATDGCRTPRPAPPLHREFLRQLSRRDRPQDRRADGPPHPAQPRPRPPNPDPGPADQAATVTAWSRRLAVGAAGLIAAAAPALAAPAAAQTGEPAASAVPGDANAAPDALAARRPPPIDAGAAAVYEPVTGDLVFAYRANRGLPIASTTKLMTAFVVLERDPLNRVFASPGYSPSFSDESLIHLRAGERMSVADLLRGMLLASGNDAAVDLAVNTAGSEGAFVALMNRAARRLGLRHTHYTNPIGLDSAGNYS